MRQNLSLISSLIILGTAFVFSSVVVLLNFIFTHEIYDKRVQELEQEYILKNRNLVKNEVDRAIGRAKSIEKLIYDNAIIELKEKTRFIYSLVETEYNHKKEHHDHKEADLVDFLKNTIELHRWDGGNIDLNLIDEHGTILYHSVNHEIEAKNIYQLPENYENFKVFFSKIKTLEEYSGTYSWKKTVKGDDKLVIKHAYAIKRKDLPFYIISEINQNEIAKVVKESIVQELYNDRYGDNGYGYFYILNLDYTMLMHPIMPELVGKNLKNDTDLGGKKITQMMFEEVKKNGSGYIQYLWYRPDNRKADQKTTYGHLMDSQNIVIASGFYYSELTEILDVEKSKLKHDLNSNLGRIIEIIIWLVLASILSAWYVGRRVNRIESQRKDYLHMLEQYKLILDKSAVVSKTSLDGKITYVNESFCSLSGFERSEIIGRKHSILKHPQSPRKQFLELWQTIEKGNIWHGLLRNKTKNGESYYNRTTIVPIKDAKGNTIEYISAGTDITELIENRNKLQIFFKTDSLTGLGNRVALIDTLTQNQGGSIALINIKHFKEINDTHGNDVGDETIKELAKRLFDFFTPEKNYTVFRVQADEFAVYSAIKIDSKLEIPVDKFFSSLGREAYQIDHHYFFLTYTAGIATGDENIFPYADIALSLAKKANLKIKKYETSMNNIKEFKNNIMWVEKLYMALKQDNVYPFYQPIVNYQTNKVEKYECLMRLFDGEKIIAPGEYLAIAKQTTLYPELTYKIVIKSINYFAESESDFSINLSVEDLMNEELMIFLFDYAERNGVFNRMVLEVIESDEMESYEEILRIFKRFKKRGTRIAIDDFGSGYSNYDYLILLEADIIKIDGSITKQLLNDPRTQEIVVSIVRFAKKYNMKTIAEFVSSKELDEVIRKLGVDYGQGYYLGKPQADVQNH